jgi:hypothetical protein
VLASSNTRAVELIARILAAGVAARVFKPKIDAIDVHMLISMFCVFRVANRYTFNALFGRDLADRRRRKHYRAMLGDVVVAYLTS